MGLDEAAEADQGVGPAKTERAPVPAAPARPERLDQPDQPDRPDRPDRPAKRDDPDKSAAELDVGWGERLREPDGLSEEDERLLRERPPHWE